MKDIGVSGRVADAGILHLHVEVTELVRRRSDIAVSLCG